MFIDVRISGDRKKPRIFYNRNSAHAECKNKSDTSNNRGDWNHLNVTETNLSNIPGKHEIKELKKKKSHIGPCTYTAESADGKVQNIIHGRNNITCSTDCEYRTAATHPTHMVCCGYITVNTVHKGDDMMMMMMMMIIIIIIIMWAG